jgi:heme oxygenase
MTVQLAQVLKTSTRALHDSAEGSQFQSHLTSGKVTLQEYSTYLGQLFLVHSRLEAELKRAFEKDARLQQIINDEQMQEGHLLADLNHFKVQPKELEPLNATERFLLIISKTASQQPLALLGMHYVLFGSKHGGKFIAKNLSEAHKLNGVGTKYFDPYGDEFMPYWRSFVDKMNELQPTEKELEEIVQAAKDTFVAVGEIGREMEARSH